MDSPDGVGVEPTYNGLSPKASLNLATSMGQLDPKDKSSTDRVMRNIQASAANEAKAIQKRMYEKGRLDRLEADRNDERERNIAQRWNSSDTGRRSGLTWDKLDDDTKQEMRNRLYDFYKGSNAPQSLDAPDPVPSATTPPPPPPQASTAPKPTYIPRFGRQGFEGFNEGSAGGRFIPSAGQDQKTALASLMRQDKEDAESRQIFDNDNPFGTQFRPSARRKRDEEEIYNPFS